MKHVGCLIFFLLTANTAVLAQLSGRVFTIQAGYGFVLRHADKIGQASLTHPYYAEFSYSRLTDGSREWHKPYRYPETGLVAGVLNYHTALLGTAFYVFPYAEKTMLDLNAVKLNLRIGFGGAYLTKKYDPDDNFQNISIGSHLNYMLRGEGAVNIKLALRWKLRLAATLTHFSNGSFKQPNAGINTLSLGTGISYLPHFQYYTHKTDTFAHAFRKGFSVNLAGAFTAQEIEYPGEKKYLGGNFISYLSYRLNRKSAVNLGLDVFFNSAHRHIIEETHPSGNLPDYKQAGITLGHELFVSRLSLLTQVGYYVYAPQANQAAVYERYALKYAWSRRFFSSLALKAHYGTAEYTEWTAGFVID